MFLSNTVTSLSALHVRVMHRPCMADGIVAASFCFELTCIICSLRLLFIMSGPTCDAILFDIGALARLCSQACGQNEGKRQRQGGQEAKQEKEIASVNKASCVMCKLH